MLKKPDKKRYELRFEEEFIQLLKTYSVAYNMRTNKFIEYVVKKHIAELKKKIKIIPSHVLLDNKCDGD